MGHEAKQKYSDNNERNIAEHFKNKIQFYIPDHQQDAERHKTHQEGNNDDKKHAVDVSVDDCSTAQIIRHD